MAYLLLLICITLVGSVYLNRFLCRWHDQKIREIRRRRAAVDLKLRKQRHRLERINDKLKEVEETHQMYSGLIEKKERLKNVEPGDWLLDHRHITLNGYLQAKKYGERNNKDIVDSCMILNLIDRRVARQAREAVGAAEQKISPLDDGAGEVVSNG